MKRISVLFEYLAYFVVGNLIFNIIYSIVEVTVINNIGGYELYIKKLLLSFRETIIIYIIVYLFFIIANIIYKKTIINKLNNKLKDIRRNKNEK